MFNCFCKLPTFPKWFHCFVLGLAMRENSVCFSSGPHLVWSGFCLFLSFAFLVTGQGDLNTVSLRVFVIIILSLSFPAYRHLYIFVKDLLAQFLLDCLLFSY